MTRRPYLFGPLALLLASIAQAADAPAAARLADDFRNNTLADYETEGALSWQKGEVALGKDARLTRRLALGHAVVIRAAVRLPKGEGLAGLVVALKADRGGAITLSLLRNTDG